MGHTQIAGCDRLSNLGDDMIGHVFSFLDTKEAARAAALSSRWRHIMASVHTISLEQLDRPNEIYEKDDSYERHELRPFVVAVTAALLSRSRRPAPATASVPLRALRVSMESRGFNDKPTVDQWVSYALWNAAPEFDLDLRIGRRPVCWRPFGIPDDSHIRLGQHLVSSDHPHRARPEDKDDDDDVGTSDDEGDHYESYLERAWTRIVNALPMPPDPYYTVLRRLFSCDALRSLRLGSCRLSTPAVISLPALETLHLTHVPDMEEKVQRLVSSCPRLADLTLEACKTVAVLSLLENMRLRRLVFRCCHNLVSVAVDGSMLRSFEYSGAVPQSSLLTIRGGGGLPPLESCKVDICAVCRLEEATSEEELDKLGLFMQLFASTMMLLNLSSTLMSCCFVNIPTLPNLRHLELNGRVPRGGDRAAVVTATSRILQQAPNLELLTLIFEETPQFYARTPNEEGHLDAHHLLYHKYDDIDYATLLSIPTVPSCLGSRLREIELVHYEGGKAQRTLARYLLHNAAVLEKLYCAFAEGPEWMQMELMCEIEDWLINETTCKEFR